MPHSNKPIIWGLFAVGGTLAAFIVPALILVTCFAIPLGLLPIDVLAYERLIDLMRHALSKLVTFGVLILIIWHAAHRMRITAHDLGIRNDTLIMFVCYGIAAAATLLALAALLRI